MSDAPRGVIASKPWRPPLCITLRQPWAHLVAHHRKLIENRSWSTDYRGPLCIHAGTNMTTREYLEVRNWVLQQELVTAEAFPARETLIFGAIIAVTKLLDVRRTPVTKDLLPWEMPGGYSWLLAPVRSVIPFPCLGTQGLWSLPRLPSRLTSHP